MNLYGCEWDAVLRALVDRAFTRRGTVSFADACRDIVDTHRRWPLVELSLHLEEALRLEAEMEARAEARRELLASCVELLHSSYPVGVAA